MLDCWVNFFHRNRRLVRIEINVAKNLEMSDNKLGHTTLPLSDNFATWLNLRRPRVLIFSIKRVPSNLRLTEFRVLRLSTTHTK